MITFVLAQAPEEHRTIENIEKKLFTDFETGAIALETMQPLTEERQNLLEWLQSHSEEHYRELSQLEEVLHTVLHRRPL